MGRRTSCFGAEGLLPTGSLEAGEEDRGTLSAGVGTCSRRMIVGRLNTSLGSLPVLGGLLCPLKFREKTSMVKAK